MDQILAILACRSGSKGSLQERLHRGDSLAGLLIGTLPTRPFDKVFVHLHTGIVGQAIPAQLGERRAILALK
jgi:hypothetical protein